MPEKAGVYKMARPKSKKEWNIYPRGGILQVDLRKAGGGRVSSELEDTKANRKALETEIIPLLILKLKGDEQEAKSGLQKLREAKTATTVEVFGRKSLEMNAGRRQPHIQSKYVQAFENHILPYFGKKKIEDVSGLDLKLWLQKLNQVGFATMKKAKIVMTQMLNDAIMGKIIGVSPMNGVTPPQRLTEEPEPQPFNSLQIGLLLQNAKPNFKNVVALLIFTGMRPSELAALEWENVDFANKKIHIVKTLKKAKGNEPKIGKTKTKSSKRAISMCSTVENLLKAQYMQTGLNGGRVILNRYGKGFTGITAWEVGFARLLEVCNIPHRSLYQCRHTYASMALTNGENILKVSKSMGHKNPQITFEKYARFIQEEKEEKEAHKPNFSHNFSHIIAKIA